MTQDSNKDTIKDSDKLQSFWISRYIKLIRDDLEELKNTANVLVPSKYNAYNYAKFSKFSLMSLGFIVGILGTINTAADPLGISNVFGSWLSFLSAVLGFCITFITNNFNPVKFRQRTIDLGQIINEFYQTIEDYEFELDKCLAVSTTDNDKKLKTLEKLEKELDSKKNDLMVKARVLKTSL